MTVLLFSPVVVFSQKKISSKVKKPTDVVAKKSPDQFPITNFWDQALAVSQKSGRPVLAFDVDYIDSSSIAFRDGILHDRKVREFLNKHFELAVNDYSVDPPPTVGFDSLRNLGLRLDDLEKGYLIAVRPTAIMIRPDKSEVDRISHPERLSPTEFIKRLSDYLAGKGTISDVRTQFWLDSTNMDKRIYYLEKLVERSEYDSTIRHLSVVAEHKEHPAIAKEARKRLAFMRFETERKPSYLTNWITTLSHSSEDSSEAVNAMFEILSLYQAMKKVDSMAVWYEHVMTFTKERDPDLLNNFAWDLVHFSTHYDSALAIANEAIEKKSTEPNYFDTRALIYSMKKNYDAAIADAKQAQLLKPEDEYFRDRVEFYERMKKEAENDKKEPEQKKQ